MRNVGKKDLAWKRLLNKAALTGDRLGMGIDSNILPVIAGLWAHGINTTGSCEGHLDHGEAYPWIRVESFPPKHWGDIQTWWVDKNKQKQLFKKNKPNLIKLHSLLVDFYVNNPTDYKKLLAVVEVNTFIASGSLQPIETEVTRLLSKKELFKRQKLYIAEMQRFGAFLREKFYQS